jgi:hypothetical protein
MVVEIEGPRRDPIEQPRSNTTYPSDPDGKCHHHGSNSIKHDQTCMPRSEIRCPGPCNQMSGGGGLKMVARSHDLHHGSTTYPTFQKLISSGQDFATGTSLDLRVGRPSPPGHPDPLQREKGAAFVDGTG